MKSAYPNSHAIGSQRRFSLADGRGEELAGGRKGCGKRKGGCFDDTLRNGRSAVRSWVVRASWNAGHADCRLSKTTGPAHPALAA